MNSSKYCDSKRMTEIRGLGSDDQLRKSHERRTDQHDDASRVELTQHSKSCAVKRCLPLSGKVAAGRMAQPMSGLRTR